MSKNSYQNIIAPKLFATEAVCNCFLNVLTMLFCSKIYLGATKRKWIAYAFTLCEVTEVFGIIVANG